MLSVKGTESRVSADHAVDHTSATGTNIQMFVSWRQVHVPTAEVLDVDRQRMKSKERAA
jgi:hypothetical protein